MRLPAGHWLLIATFIGALAACTSAPEPAVDPNLFPTGFKKEIIDTLMQTLGDPTNIRNAFITDPALTKLGNDQRYAVCVRFDTRDANQHYMGSADHIAYFYAGHLNQLIDASKEQCGSAAYKPFHELEKICFGARCN